MLSTVSNLMTGVFGSRNQRLLKRYGSLVAAANALEAQLKRFERRAVARQDGRAQGALRGAEGPRRAAARGVRARPRGRATHAEDAALRRPVDRRHRAAPGQDRRDADRRGQDAGRDARGLLERADRQRRAHRDGQRVPRAARRGLDGARLPVPRARGRRDQEQSADRREAPRLRSRTSPTARTTSSASTICATTSRSVPRTACSASSSMRSSTRSTRS